MEQQAQQHVEQQANQRTSGDPDAPVTPKTLQNPRTPNTIDHLIQLEDGDLHVVEDGEPNAPALLLLTNAVAPTAIWDQAVPSPAATHRVIRVDLLRRLRTESSPRKAARTGFTRPVEIPDAFLKAMMELRRRTFVAVMRAYRDYLRQRSLPDRLMPLRLSVRVIFGEDDKRWRASSAAAYRAVPGAGPTPMLEGPETAGALLPDFAELVESVRGTDG